MRSRSNSGQRLDVYHRTVYQTILKHQNPVTGLLPLSATNSHAWVRDNLYSVMAVWGLAMAYRKNADMDEDRAKAYELEQSVVKLMRGLLRSMMQQVEKLEKFKSSQAAGDALHAKYSSRDCCPVVGDHNWGHLQIDATSLFLLTLSQMTASGLQIIFTLDEVAFIQNLVFYIESAYRIPDYGIWERGDKTNHGLPELNASSIGMAKAALEAIDELDLFGARGGPTSVIHVLADEAAQCKAVLQSMLPRESNSKEVDSALLSIISFPAFAVDDQNLIDLTRDTIVDKLKGQYGCRRFLRDGYKTAKEDPRRLHYEPWELKIFENIECEWPVFYAYLLLDGVFSGSKEQVSEYRDALDRIMVKSADGINMMPELYTVPADKVEQEYVSPKSQERLPIGQLPHKWGQSMYILGRLLQDDFLSPGELDPLNRRLVTEPKPDLVVQVALIAEDSMIQEKLLSHGLKVQTLKEINHVRVFPGKLLRELYSNLGKCKKLGLSGRPSAECGLLTTSKLYRMNDEIWAFTPQFLDSTAFYLVLDTEFLLDQFRTDIAYLRTNWQMLGRPTVIITISHWMIDYRQSLHPALAATLKKLQTGYINGTRVLLGYLTDFLSTSCITKLTFLSKQEEGEELAEDGICKIMEDLISPTSIQRHLPSSEVPFRKRRVSQEMRRRSSSVHGIIRRSRSIQVEANDESGYLPVHGTHLLRPSTSSERLTRTSSTALFQTLDCDELVNLLKQTESMHEQADIIHYLYITKGSEWDTQMAGKAGCTIKDLQVELYQKAGKMKKWWLVRHAAGMLKKRVDDLAKATTDILVRQKQLSVGQPSLREMVITSPRNPEETARIIHEACGDDSSTAVLTQELLVYLAMFIRTEPQLFHEMLRIRVGLIIQVMASELARTLKCPGDEASEQLLNLSPFEMKTLLHHILSGKEFGPRTELEFNYAAEEWQPVLKITRDEGKRSILRKVQDEIQDIRTTVDQAMYHNAESLEEALESDRQGQWLRRRRLDGALNRVPVGFYPRIWRLLERSTGIQIDGYFLQQNLTREMTPGELKFALQVEGGLNRIPNPEYRQLLVEAMMVLCELAEHDNGKSNLKLDIQVENIVKDAQKIFLEDQIKFDGDATTCCAAKTGSKERKECNSSKGICQHFYDSAPSGKYGTISYMWRAVANSIELAAVDGNLDCAVS